MNTFSKFISLTFAAFVLFSCSKSDKASETPLRDYTDQYNIDIANIEEFMQTHYMTVVNNPGQSDDMDVTFTKIPEGGTQTSIWSQTDYPIQTREVTLTQNEKEVTYKLYYLQLREGSGQSPCNVDNVLAGYRGEYLYTSKVDEDDENSATEILGNQFEENKNPQNFSFLYNGVIKGWSEIFPKFKTGIYSENSDGTVSYNNFGAGVVFIPSGLAYFGTYKSPIPSYSPLVFSIKLFELQRADQDNDGIPSYLEDLNGDGYMYLLAGGITNVDDTDGDGIPDFLDTDDDGDGYLTSYEIKNLTANPVYTYSFDEIPTCGGSGNGKKRHLDASCHN